MAKKNEKKKPDEILMLEKVYGFNIDENNYLLDKEGQLHYLDFDGKEIDSYAPLSGLKNLAMLSVANSGIVDIEPFAALKSLTHLYLYSNSITDISPLAELKNLRSLHLDWNSITDISPLAALKNLTTLYLDSNSITDISPLAGLKDLTGLYIGGNSITDISPLAGLKDLASVRISENSITDISPLAGLKNLVTLDVSNNHVEDISVLSDSKLLKGIDVRRNKIQKITTSIPDLAINLKSDDDFHLGGLYLADNPITEPPLEIVQQGKAAIVKYWEEKERTGARKINEVRLILIGHGGAGKTNLVHHILDESYNEQEQQTHGIIQTQWKFKEDSEE